MTPTPETPQSALERLSRYGPQFDHDDPHVFNGMGEESLGDWVRWDDVLAALRASERHDCDNDRGLTCKQQWPTSRSSWCEGCLDTLVEVRASEGPREQELLQWMLNNATASYADAEGQGARDYWRGYANAVRFVKQAEGRQGTAAAPRGDDE